jgi:hypothetical protein
MKHVRYAPDELLAKYHSIRSQVPVDVFYSSPKHGKTMEFWCAAQFARGYATNLAPCSIWIHEGDAQAYFDFQLEVDARKLNFQLTEVQLAGRRRGDEYRKSGPSGYTTVDDWDKGEEFGGEWIASAIKRKWVKYGGGDVSELSLLVYVNYVAVEHPYLKLREQIADAAAPFRSVWLLNGHAIACVATRDRDLSAQAGWMFVPDDPCDEL